MQSLDRLFENHMADGVLQKHHWQPTTINIFYTNISHIKLHWSGLTIIHYSVINYYFNKKYKKAAAWLQVCAAAEGIRFITHSTVDYLLTCSMFRVIILNFLPVIFTVNWHMRYNRPSKRCGVKFNAISIKVWNLIHLS